MTADAIALDPGAGLRAVIDLRRARRRRRIGDQAWGDMAYRAYTTGLAALVAVVFLSGLVGDSVLDAAGRADLAATAPSWFGLVAAVILLVGFRSGSRGGPLAMEAPDVQHMLLAPVDRSLVLRRPAVWILAYGVLGGVLVGGLVGSLVDQRIGEALLGWIASGALFGAAAVALALAAAMVTSARFVPSWLPVGLGWVFVAWAVADVVGEGPTAPTTYLGRVALWPLGFSAVSALPLVAALGLAAVGLAVVGRVSVEQARRRTALVGQLRFAVTQRDLRTVVLLRRQLAAERPRARHWFPAPPRWFGRRFPVLARDLQSVARWPLVRVLRVAVLGALAGLAARGVWAGTTPLLVAGGLAVYLAALDATEPLAQDIDHPALLGSAPVPEGLVMVRHLAEPVIVMLAAGVVGVAAAWAVEPDPEVLRVGALCLVPAALAGVAGAAITVVSDAVLDESQEAVMPPEVAGPRLLFRTVWPPLVAVLGFLPVLVARNAAGTGDPVAAAGTAAIPLLLLVGVVMLWVRFRADIHASIAEAGMGGTR